MRTHTGGCHCGRVRFEVIAPAKLEVADCNCSICSKFAYFHLIVPADRFKLISGREALSTYSFNTHIAKHFFCATCGVKSFYVPRSHPQGDSGKGPRIGRGHIGLISIKPFDGREWEKGRAEYRDPTDA